MRKLTLLIGAMLFAAAPAFAADETAPATAPAAEAPAITSQAPNSPTAAEGNSAVSPMRKGKMLRSKGIAPKKHVMHKHAKMHHKAKAEAPAAAPEAPIAQ